MTTMHKLDNNKWAKLWRLQSTLTLFYFMKEVGDILWELPTNLKCVINKIIIIIKDIKDKRFKRGCGFPYLEAAVNDLLGLNCFDGLTEIT